jgi:hypothetical protein
MNVKGPFAQAVRHAVQVRTKVEGFPMKVFLAAVAFSLVTACVWYGVLDMQQRPAAEAFAAPSAVRL